MRKCSSRNRLQHSTKKNNGILQKTQLLLSKGMIPLVQLMDKLLNKEENSEIFDLATDSLQLLAYTHRDISNVCRKFLKPAVAQKYKRLCSSHVPLTAKLLGDDLHKQLKSINEQKRIRVKMTVDNTRKRSYDRDYQPSTSHRSNYRPKGQSQSFLYRQKEHNPKYKKRERLQFPKQQQLQQEGQINAETVLSC